MSSQKTLRYFLVSLLISYLVGLIFFAPDFSESSTVHALETVNDTGEIEESGYPNINIRTISRETEDYILFVQAPVFDSEELNEFFGDYVEQVMNQFFHEVEQLGRVDADTPGNLSLKVEIEPAGEELYSVIFSEETFTGGASVNQKASVYMVDVKAGELINRAELFNDPDEAQSTIFPIIEQKLKDSEQYSAYILDDELQRWLSQTDYHFTNMYIEDGNIVFKFNKYEVLAGVAGTPEVSIPINEVKDLFKPEWLERMKVEDQTGQDFYL
ncbi:RsiV family protein [Alkalibacillus haloalkaliphilus]|uniref:RsiV family protein n=1 Tax=Alkalibacillus haloalkaliphilus TaxID=94136 RepID=UPI00293595D0|nr:RsiV family protein [Alkalibacillus haloalkaliphilus]MDV2583078.1 RsiV family protein [Alkalibacillus haloalkaliphilus]